MANRMKRPDGAATPTLVTPPSRPLDRPASPQDTPKGKKGVTEAVNVKRSVSFRPDDLAYVEAQALKLGAKRGKSMNFSEALRVMIDAHREGGNS